MVEPVWAGLHFLSLPGIHSTVSGHVMDGKTLKALLPAPESFAEKRDPPGHASAGSESAHASTFFLIASSV
jgi:hypothetical protein